jgi:CheY-like chemotaxis protein
MDTVTEAEPLKGRTILVVDDEPDQLTYIAAVLEDSGATIRKATDGEEALAAIREEKPDLMTLDLEMPGKNGIDVFVEVREDPALKDLPVCVVTGNPEMRKLIYERPALPLPEGFLDKPVSEETLILNIRKIFEIGK